MTASTRSTTDARAVHRTRASAPRWLLTRGLLALVALSALAAGDAAGQAQAPPSPLDDVDFEQRLGATLPADASFLDDAGERVTIGSLADGRPVVLALVYYNCPRLCTLVLAETVASVRATGLEPGRDVHVVFVSIDPEETPADAREARRKYVNQTFTGENAEAPPAWSFLTGDRQAISAVADAVGYRYTYDPRSHQYAHSAGIVVATPQGVVSHYLYGVRYRSRDLRLALVQASDGQVGSPVDQLLLRCFHYDPKRGRFGFVIWPIVQVLCAVTVVSLVSYIVVATRRGRQAPDPVNEH